MIARLLRAELLKMQTRASFWTFVGALGLTLGILALILSFGSADDLSEGQEFIAYIPQIGFFFPIVVGILLVTGEFWHRTITSTFLATPRRELVLAMKFTTAAAVGIAYALVSTVLAFAIAIPILALRDVELNVAGGEVAKATLLACLAMAVYGVIGAGVGAVVRNQVAAMVGTLLWFLLVELFVGPILPQWITKYSPLNAAAAAFGAADGGGEFLSPLAGGTLFVAYAVALAAIGTLLVARRDVS
jgi:ABC-2 type transport system permease protein